MNLKHLLMTPGPVPLPDFVLNALSEPMIHHRTPEFSNLLSNTLNHLKLVFKTKQPVMCVSSTGTGAMEAAILNTLSPGDSVLVVVSGKFGERWSKICETFGLNTQVINVTWGEPVDLKSLESLVNNNKFKAVFSQVCETSTGTLQPIQEMSKIIKTNPECLFIVDAISAMGAIDIPMDEWNLDVVVAGSQKAFMIPTGLSMIALSEKAWGRYEISKLPKFYFDLKAEKLANEKKQTAFSSSVSLIRALNAVLEKWSLKDFKEQIVQCTLYSSATQSAILQLGLSVFSQSPSTTLTAILLPESIDGQKLRSHLEEKHKITVMGGQDQLKGKIIRIGHLGYITKEDLVVTINNLGLPLIELYPDFLNQSQLDQCVSELKKNLDL